MNSNYPPLLSYQQSAKPGVRSRSVTPTFLARQLASKLASSPLIAFSKGNTQLDVSLLQLPRIQIVVPFGDDVFEPLPWEPFPPRDVDFGERDFCRPNFSRRGTFQSNSQGKNPGRQQIPSTVCPSRASFADDLAPPFRQGDATIRKSFVSLRQPFQFQYPNKARGAPSQTHSFPQCLFPTSMSWAKETYRAERAKRYWFTDSTRCLRNTSGSRRSHLIWFCARSDHPQCSSITSSYLLFMIEGSPVHL